MSVTVPQLDEFVVEVIPSWHVGFRCSHCHAVFTEYPPFALPHKRFVKQDLPAKTQDYLAQQRAGEPTNYRESVREQHVPPSYASIPPIPPGSGLVAAKRSAAAVGFFGAQHP